MSLRPPARVYNRKVWIPTHIETGEIDMPMLEAYEPEEKLREGWEWRTFGLHEIGLPQIEQIPLRVGMPVIMEHTGSPTISSIAILTGKDEHGFIFGDYLWADMVARGTCARSENIIPLAAFGVALHARKNQMMTSQVCPTHVRNTDGSPRLWEGLHGLKVRCRTDVYQKWLSYLTSETEVLE